MQYAHTTHDIFECNMRIRLMTYPVLGSTCRQLRVKDQTFPAEDSAGICDTGEAPSARDDSLVLSCRPSPFLDSVSSDKQGIM